MINQLKKIVPILLLLFLILVFFFPLLTFKKIPYSGDFTGSDLTELNIPFRYLFQQSIQQGKVPLWTNLLSNGFPLLAEGQTGVFYPLNLILFSLFKFPLALNLGIILNFFLAGFFVYLYARNLKISTWGSLLAALAFSWSGFFIFRLKHLNLINAAIWLPLEFLLIDRYFQAKKNKLVWVILLGLVFAIQFFVGHPQISFISVVSGFLYFIFRFFSHPNFSTKKVGIIFLFWLGVGIITLGISAVQLLPSYELAQITERHNWINYENATLYNYHPANLITFVFPYFFGNPALANYFQDIRNFGIFWESNIYLGLLPLVLALVAAFVLFKKKPIIKIMVFLLLISLIFVFGKYTTLFRIFWLLIPGLKFFRFPQRFLLLTLFSLVTLAAFGFDWLAEKIRNYLTQKGVTRKSNLFSLIMLLLIIFLAVDLFIFGIDYNSFLDYQSYYSPPVSARFLLEDKDRFNILSVNWRGSWPKIYFLSGGWVNNLKFYQALRELMPPNLNAVWGIGSIDDRGLFEGGIGGLEWYSRLQSQLIRAEPSRDPTEIIFADEVLKIIGMENVKYLLSFKALSSSNLDLVKTIPLDFLPVVKIYQNKYFLPRALAVFEAKAMTKPEILPFMFSENFKPEEMIILEQPVEYQSPGSAATAEVKIITDQPEIIKIDVDYNQPGFLFLSQVFYPGWQAFVDDQKQPILKANYAFSAIQVPAGQHQVTFVYEPFSYQLGKYITLSTIFLLILYFIYYLYRRRLYNQKHD